MVNKRKPVPVPSVSHDESQKYIEIINKASHNFHGLLDELETAIGMMMIGRLYGWRVLVLIHSKKTVKKYEEILGINVREMFEEEGPHTYKSVGYSIAQTLGNFWKAVSGETKIEGRREVA